MGKLLTINDAAWLWAERTRTPMQVGMLATFRLPEHAGSSYLTDLVAQWRTVRTFAPPFDYLAGGPLPHWRTVPHQDIDLEHHLRLVELPPSGGTDALRALVSRLHAQRLDRRRPLWQLHVVGGVGPRTWALYFKLHHSQVDGVGGLRMARRWLSVDPSHRGMLPPWAVGVRGVDQSGSTAAPPTALPPAAGSTTWGGIRSAAGSLTRTYVETVARSRDELRAVPYHAPKAAFNGRIGAVRQHATQHWEVARLRAVATAADASINDVYLAVIGGGLRRYLGELGRLPDETLTANVPVSVRTDDPDRVGNALTFLWSTLATDLADPAARLEAVRESTRLAKDRVPTASRTVTDVYTVLLMLPVLAQAVTGTGGVGRPAFNVVVSNIPGFTEQRWLEGSALEEFYPLSLLFHGQGLNVTAVSNEDWFGVGYTAARDAVPDVQRVADLSGAALEELEAAYGTGGGCQEAAASPTGKPRAV